MTDNRAPEIDPQIPIEPERYELHAPPVHHFEIDRRDFAKLVGAGIAVFLISKGAIAQQQQGESGARGGFGGQSMPKDISAWLHINEDGAVTVYTGKVEIGQNIRTSLAQAVAEELRVPFESIQIVMGDTKLTPFDAGTFGSQTTPRMGPQLRHVASAACDTLRDLAAKQWNVDAARLVPIAGKITDPQTKRSISYGKLAEGQALAKAIPDTDPLVPPTEWTNFRQAHRKSGWPRFRHRQAQIHVGHEAAGHALRQNFAASLRLAQLSPVWTPAPLKPFRA